MSLGKLMLYQLSYSRSMTYGWWGLQVSKSVSIRKPPSILTIARDESPWKLLLRDLFRKLLDRFTNYFEVANHCIEP